MARQECDYFEDIASTLKGVFKTKDFSASVSANTPKLVDASLSGYTPISIICTGTNIHSRPPHLYGNSIYVICDASVTITWRVVYIKNGILNT